MVLDVFLLPGVSETGAGVFSLGVDAPAALFGASQGLGRVNRRSGGGEGGEMKAFLAFFSFSLFFFSCGWSLG